MEDIEWELKSRVRIMDIYRNVITNLPSNTLVIQGFYKVYSDVLTEMEDNFLMKVLPPAMANYTEAANFIINSDSKFPAGIRRVFGMIFYNRYSKYLRETLVESAKAAKKSPGVTEKELKNIIKIESEELLPRIQKLLAGVINL